MILKYIGILPKSEVKPNYHAKFVYSKTVSGKNVDYYECLKIIDKQKELNTINIKLTKTLTKDCIYGLYLFDNPYNK